MTRDLHECPICLEIPEPSESILLSHCFHMFCGRCVVELIESKDVDLSQDPLCCPVCRTVTHTAIVQKHLDGEISDTPYEESLHLLSRARWLRPTHPVTLWESSEEDGEVDVSDEFTALEDSLLRGTAEGSSLTCRAVMYTRGAPRSRVVLTGNQAASDAINRDATKPKKRRNRKRGRKN